MKKLIALALTVLAAGLIGFSDVQAQDLEISGHVNIVDGWQRTHGNSAVAPAGAAGLLTDGLIAPGGATTDQFGFFVDEVELDLAKSFGENIRLRADIDFNPGGNRVGPAVGQVGVEQAYVTVNVPVGNGGELLFGRFNSGVGLDPIDRNELSGISFSTIHRRLLPQNITGVNFYYGIDESWSFDIFVVNDLQDAAVGVTTDIPSGGFTIEWSNAEGGEGTWVKFSGLIGPERATKKGYSFIGDLAAAINVTEGFYIDVEGMYRQDNSAGGAGTENAQYLAGTLQFRYAFSDIWDGTLRYGFMWDLDQGQVGGVPAGGIPANPLAGASGLGFAGQQHDITLAAGYAITDGARFVLEGRYDLGKASAGGKYHVYGLGAGFYYDF